MEILPASVEDYDEIIKLYRKYGFALRKREWWEWKYFGNPHFNATPFKIIDQGVIAGAVAVLPQTFHYRGRKLTALQAVDGLMGKEIRGKHLFNEVMGFVLQYRPDWLEGDYFYLGFASVAASTRALENAGWRRIANFRLYTCLLNHLPLRKISLLNHFSPLLGQIGKIYRRTLFAGSTDTIRISMLDRFSRDPTSSPTGDRVTGDRGNEFLNWRVTDNPRDDMRSFSVYDGDTCAGHIICKCLDRNFEVVESSLGHRSEKKLAAFLKYLYDQNVADSVDFWVLDNAPDRPLLPRFAFRRRKITGAAFIRCPEHVDLPSAPEEWNIGFLDSDW